MAFPILNWFQRQLTAERIDQHFARNSYRLIIGLELQPDFGSLQAALLLTAGRGKYLRVQHADADQLLLPEVLQNDLQRLQSGSSKSGPIDAADCAGVLFDLAECQSKLVQQLKARAGKYVDRILAVSVMDPGLWTQDFDGRTFYRPACDAFRLAELTGLNVIDAFPQADLYAAGNGKSLSALPLWLQYADRSSPRAKYSTIVIELNQSVHCWGLPGSDGADDWLPTVSWRLLSSDLTADSISIICQRARSFIEDWQRMVDPFLPIGKIILIGPEQLTETLQSQLQQNWPERSEELIWHQNPVAMGLMGGLLGMLHVDQIPANMPGLTGASGLRILGRLTPGKLSAWRQLLVNMTDTQSPIMRLRDAV